MRTWMMASTAVGGEEGEVALYPTINPSPSSTRRTTSKVTAAAAGAATHQEVAQALTATFDPSAPPPLPHSLNAPRKTILSSRKRTQQQQQQQQQEEDNISKWGEKETMALQFPVGIVGIRTAAAVVVICMVWIHSNTACPHYHYHQWEEEKKKEEKEEEEGN